MSKSNKTSTKSSGIGLIEIVISLTVFAIGILGVLQAFPRGLAAEKKLELAALAEQLAQAKIEELAVLSYAEIAVGVIENQVPVENFFRSTSVELLKDDFSPGGLDKGLKKIMVTVAWPDALGGSQASTTLVYLKSQI